MKKIKGTDMACGSTTKTKKLVKKAQTNWHCLVCDTRGTGSFKDHVCVPNNVPVSTSSTGEHDVSLTLGDTLVTGNNEKTPPKYWEVIEIRPDEGGPDSNLVRTIALRKTEEDAKAVVKVLSDTDHFWIFYKYQEYKQTEPIYLQVRLGWFDRLCDFLIPDSWVQTTNYKYERLG